MDNENMQGSCCAGSRVDFESTVKTEKQTEKIKQGQQIKYKEKMIYLPEGEFLMGTEDNEGFPADGEGPIIRPDGQLVYARSADSSRAGSRFGCDRHGESG
ncbi:hypothetical protein [Halalkalibacter sp. APA_J-10(15)]|uniref:hypothetical protein n=1 Tax=unclassified Halalkalibacter TaxID=2893063 RepID=UPI002365D39B|nr:hypothetical protein [Halalkalibacter sp. APA_J-10(15)]